MKHTYKTQGTCSRVIEIEIEDGILKDVTFIGGCMGNTSGVAALAKGRPVQEVLDIVDGILCGSRGTSCPDQLGKAIRDAMK